MVGLLPLTMKAKLELRHPTKVIVSFVRTFASLKGVQPLFQLFFAHVLEGYQFLFELQRAMLKTTTYTAIECMPIHDLLSG